MVYGGGSNFLSGGLLLVVDCGERNGPILKITRWLARWLRGVSFGSVFFVLVFFFLFSFRFFPKKKEAEARKMESVVACARNWPSPTYKTAVVIKSIVTFGGHSGIIV